MLFVALVKAWLHGRAAETSGMAKCTHTIDAGTPAPWPWANLDKLDCPRLRGQKHLDPGLEEIYMEVCLKNTRVMRGEKGHQDLQVSNLNTDSSPAIQGAVATRRWLGNWKTASTMPLSQCTVFLADPCQKLGYWGSPGIRGKTALPLSIFVKPKKSMTKHAGLSNVFPMK